eukprot:1836483-Rhodomonas_salina.1
MPVPSPYVNTSPFVRYSPAVCCYAEHSQCSTDMADVQVVPYSSAMRIAVLAGSMVLRGRAVLPCYTEVQGHVVLTSWSHCTTVLSVLWY